MWSKIKTVVGTLGVLTGVIIFLGAHEMLWVAKWLVIGAVLLVAAFYFFSSGEPEAAVPDAATLRMKAAGLQELDKLPMEVPRFGRSRRNKKEKIWRQFLLQAQPEIYLVNAGTEAILDGVNRYWLIWRSKVESKCALALERNEMGASDSRVSRLVFIEPATFPAGFPRADLFCEMPEGPSLFFGTKLAARYGELLGRDKDATFELQDGWARVSVPDPAAIQLSGEKTKTGFLELARGFETALATPEAPLEFSIQVVEEVGVDIDDGMAQKTIRLGRYVPKAIG
jgi:hypothetical protein